MKITENNSQYLLMEKTNHRTCDLICVCECVRAHLYVNINKQKSMQFCTGDLMDEEAVLDFLTSLEAMDLPDRIEDVNARILSKIIEDTDYVAVLFCKYKLKYKIMKK